MSRKSKARLTHEDRASIARRYAYESYDTTMDYLAIQYGCSKKVLSSIIHKAIETGFYSEKECLLVKEKIYALTAERSIDNYTPRIIINAYEKSYQKRKIFPTIKAELELLNFQLQSFDDWISSDEEKERSKQEIENRISALKKLL